MTPEDLAKRGIAVKPLVWEGSILGCYLRATSPFGVYEISVEYGDEWYGDFTAKDTRRSIRLSGNQDDPVVPQAAAEADHIARVCAILEVIGRADHDPPL